MKFRTEIEIPPSSLKIDHQSPILSLGSCFADRMGKRLLEHKFPVQVNPFGTVYNPFSIRKLIEASLNEDLSLADDLFQREGHWHSYHFHSDFSHSNKKIVSKSIGDSLVMVRKFLLEARFLILTFGTAWAWKKKGTKEIVSNCHKVPKAEFQKELLQPNNLLLAWATTLRKLQKLNPDIQVLVSVSPIRHTREGLPNNQLSKSILRVFCDELCKNVPGVIYFPAYEIMVDDLREYRFYEADLIHPNAMAETYIWEKFGAVYFSQETQVLIEKWQKIKRGLAHRPFDPGSEANHSFLKQLLSQLKEVSLQLNCTAEIKEINSRLLGDLFLP